MLSARARRLVSLLAALTALLLAGCAGVTTTPAIHGLGAQNRVRAFIPAAQLLVGPAASQSSCLRPGSTTSAAGMMAGFCVAAEDVLATPVVENAKLQNIVNDLYKGTTNPGRLGNGTTADAVRAEAETGQPTGGVFHTTKAEQYSTALSKLLQRGDLNPHDRLVAQSQYNDLQNALGNGP